MASLDQNETFLYLFPALVVPDENGVRTLRWADAAGPFAQNRALAVNPCLTRVHWCQAVFSPEECAQVIALGEEQPRIDGRLELGLDAYRVSHISWIGPRPDN